MQSADVSDCVVTSQSLIYSQGLVASPQVPAVQPNSFLDRIQGIVSPRPDRFDPFINDLEHDQAQRSFVSVLANYDEEQEELVGVYGGQKRNNCKFKTRHPIYVNDMPYYPECSTSLDKDSGILYVIDMSDMDAKQRENLHGYIAYAHKEAGSGNKTTVSFADAGIMYARRFACEGAKICTGLHLEVIHRHNGKDAGDLLKRNAALSHDLVGLNIKKPPGPAQS